jgi:hypothetical protein
MACLDGVWRVHDEYVIGGVGRNYFDVGWVRVGLINFYSVLDHSYAELFCELGALWCLWIGLLIKLWISSLKVEPCLRRIEIKDTVARYV